MEKIKILHMITHLGVGGAQENTFLTVKGHARDRYVTHLAAGLEQADWRERGQEVADDFFVLPGLRRSLRPYADLQALNQVTDFLKERKYDIVHTHCAKAGVLGRIAARRAHVPIVIHTFHCFAWQVTRTIQRRPWHAFASAVKKRFYVMIERHAASLSDALITVCELNKQEAIDLKLAPPQKFTTIYSGIDLGRFQVRRPPSQIRLDLGIPPNIPVIGTIGRLSDQKAPLDFVAAARLVLRQKPNVQFIMVGDGPLAAQVREAIAEDDRIKLFGYRDNVPELLSVLDVFALSSLWEGLGRALTEAMIMRVPVAATNVDGVPELVSHYLTGLLSPPGDPARLAENIIWLLDHPGEAQRMAKNAHARVVPAFGSDRMVRQIEALYERLLVKKGYDKRAIGESTYLVQNYPRMISR
jgi:glycosyltransferase involved in cell wall biosynthesis